MPLLLFSFTELTIGAQCNESHGLFNFLRLLMSPLVGRFQWTFLPTQRCVSYSQVYQTKGHVVQGITTAPYPFQCQITLRSDSKAKLIKVAFLDAADTFVRFENDISAEDKEWIRNYRSQ
ncbi:uncharacterized protein EV420DRAFT_73512 [Desarmillaria tabescens]|uniref:Uncharacterized protein n=1 Tax=Armillaria tabescens TaxID=1929756 RepID=A0AA39NQ97_ARMTA|nr:uncharacterized protein EV420DRAFT_73512 [Desarmillaria tabescens]KAK0469877.1 hypothetical protein EV420DRAFT_73512 [Desarmillaria tabescens]